MSTLAVMSLPRHFADWQSRVDARMSVLLPSEDLPAPALSQSMAYSALAPGKRVRPLLCMASALAVGGDPEAALDGACSLEFLHVFSLIHDDLPAIDNDDLRRGRPTNHKVYGEGMAILAGDALFALALKVALTSHAEPAIAHRAGLCLAECAEVLVRGEVLDVLSEGENPDLTLVQEIHAMKTGALLGCACEMGGRLGGANEAQAASLRAYGQHLGLAFQIADDVLNETGNEEQLGKASGSDRARGKQTYVAVMGVDEARAAAEREISAALAALDDMPGETDTLRTFARYVIDRQH